MFFGGAQNIGGGYVKLKLITVQVKRQNTEGVNRREKIKGAILVENKYRKSKNKM